MTNCFDTAARMTGTWLRNSSGTILNKHSYLYNTAGQRQRNTLTDNSYTIYGYDDDAQLNSSLGYTSGGTPITSEQLGFGYDAGWNMTSRSVNGILANYTINDLNQMTNAASVPCTYDQNGNRVTYGQGSGTTQYTFDDENRLVRASYSTAYRTDFTYDGLSRLRVRTEYAYNLGWYVTATIRYIYDGKRVIQEREANNTPLVAYTRGKDLSGSLEGAGGIGGLLARSSGYSGGSWTSHAFYHADGNGNITSMVDSGQAVVASYKYDPYGRTISSSGSLAGANVYRFSSKEFHANSGFYYYLYRFYDPNTQRWLSRDPIQELGGLNLYAFVGNSPISLVDAFGKERDCTAGNYRKHISDIPPYLKKHLRLLRAAELAAVYALYNRWKTAANKVPEDPNGLYWVPYGFGFGSVSFYDPITGSVINLPAILPPASSGPVILYTPSDWEEELGRRIMLLRGT